jgi:hypothetical protein
MAARLSALRTGRFLPPGRFLVLIFVTVSRPQGHTVTNTFEPQRHAEAEGNTRHKRKNPAPPPMLVTGITNTRRLTATIEQVGNRFKSSVGFGPQANYTDRAIAAGQRS